MKPSSKFVIWFVPLAFAIYILINKFYFAELYHFLMNYTEAVLAYFMAYLLVGLPLFVTVIILFGRQSFEALGMSRSLLKGFGLALLFTLPMFIGYAVVFDFNQNLDWRQIMLGAVFAGFFEEMYFRAFFFGLLFRYTRLGFIPSVLLGAIIFGSLHLYQSNDIGVMTGIFITTILGAGFFAWLYTEWKFNFWFIAWLHTMMNLSWMLFEAGDNALGGIWSNVFRVMAIALAIFITIRYKSMHGSKWVINRNTLISKT
ncbi:MAG: CPBP family intramembrane metalloprotease [Bacteroidales bacterium]|nr:CPBP family intramembrane metalloprotease [Bacteroidales bacterium]